MLSELWHHVTLSVLYTKCLTKTHLLFCKMDTFILFLLGFVASSVGLKNSSQAIEEHKVLKLGEKKLSEYVLAILEHYKQKDPVGMPGVPVPDPLSIPPFSHSFSVGHMNFQNVTLHGLTKFRIEHVTADLAAMQVDAALLIDKLDVFGNYTLSTWISRSMGPFTVKLTDVFVQASARLEVEREGHLEAQEMNMDITFKNIEMNFENLGFLATVFQGVMNSVGTVVFDSIKPFILSEVNTNLRNDVNKQVRTIPQTFPNSISPFDQVVAEARRKVRNMGYDPYKIEDYSKIVGVFEIKMTHTWLTGLASFHRFGNISFTLRNNTVQGDLQVGTQKLHGTSLWEVSLVGMLSRAGSVSFSVDYLKVQVVASQPMDTRNKPTIDDIQLELGNIQVRFDGAGTIDYAIELAINVLPNLIRYQIMDALESPIKQRIQEELDAVNVEELIHENLPKLDEHQKNGFSDIL